MSIANEIKRIKDAKAAIKQSIENKGVSVSDTAKLDEYAALIDSIELGSGGNENDWLDIRTNDGSNYAYLFYSCYAESLDLSSLDTSRTTNMNSLFRMCSRLTSLDLSNWDTSKVTNMGYMFNSCSYLTTLDLSGLDTSSVTNMGYMFAYCSILTQLDLSNFNTSQVTSMDNMFSGCSRLTSLDLSGWNTNNVTDMGYMFSSCSKLTTLDLSSFNTSKVTDMGYMFNGCSALTSLDLSNFDVSKVTSNSNLKIFGISSMPQLTDFQAPKNIGVQFDASNCTGLTHDSLMSIINNLVTVTSTKKLILGATNLAKLTNEEKAIATNKGWTLA